MARSRLLLARPARLFFSAMLVASVASCSDASSGSGDATPIGNEEQHWDSDDGNPTHPTHSFLAEFAVKQVRADFPEVADFEKDLVKGANLELHELPLKKKNEAYEALRQEIGGSNWAADRPEILWERARASYTAGDKAAAYFHVGVMLHYVQDMGVPAHAFHVIHQSGPKSWDHIEVLAFFDFHADFRTPPPEDPKLADPTAYIEWSGALTREHWERAFPGVTYHRKIFPQNYDAMTEENWAFLRAREAQCAHGTAFALRSAAAAFASLPAR